MTCTIKWNTLSFPEWEQRFKQLNRATLLQSYPYAQAMFDLNKQKPRWGLIEIEGKEAGLVQILEAGLFKNLIHAMILDRGPLWFDGFGSNDDITAFFTALNKQFPRRIGRKCRIIPEIQENNKTLDQLGYETSNTSYETIWIDVTQPQDALKEGLKKNWRGVLNKAEKAGMEIEWDSKGDHLSWLLQHYAVDRETKGYDGPSVKLLKALAKYHLPRGEFLIGRARIDAKEVAGILILCHGSGATYQVGFTTPEGRDNGAHHLLLWHALGVLKFKRIKDFDLGGINDDTAKGVKKFKSGMGGQTVRLAGMYT